jgi:uncharacterized protein YdaU (DUF1376 family)
MNWFKFDIHAYQLETHGMPDAEDLAYRRLMDRYYQEEGPLMNDADDLCASIGLDWDCISPVLLKFFLLNEADQWVHPDWQHDIERRQDRAIKASAAGKLGGRGNRRELRKPAESV